MTGTSPDQFSYVLCEYCNGGSLVDYIMRHSCKLSERKIINCMVQICEGLKHMHSLNIAHRDLKVENIFVSTSTTAGNDTDENAIFKLGDFGSATKDHSIDFTKSSKRDVGKFLSRIDKACTKMYRAPEMID